MRRMKRSIVGVVGLSFFIISCGPPKPAVTVPAPVVKAESEPATATASQQPPPAQEGLSPPQPTLRLPRNFLPTGYAVRLAVDPAASGFEGSIQIAGNLSEKSLAIWLNA